jgi:flagellar hook-associated protein 1 FlgK
MSSTFGGLEIAKRGLFAQQTALSTTGHNITNANTAGYSRQVVNLVASLPMEVPGMTHSTVPGQMGTGVEFDSITRIRDNFLDSQYYNENKENGNWSIQKNTLDQLQAITNEPSDTGIRTVISNFWKSWQDVSKEPENTTARASLKEATLAMTDAFNQTAVQLNDLKNNLNNDISVKVGNINSTLDQIATLNSQITSVKGMGDNPNDLEDQRDLLVDNLSKLINVTVDPTQSTFSLRMGNVQLISGSTVANYLSATSSSSASASSSASSSGAPTVSVDDAIKNKDLNSGEIYGTAYSRDTYLASYQFQMDSMVKALVQGPVTVTLPAGTVLPSKLPSGTVYNSTTFSGTETLNDSQRVLTADTKITVNGVNGLIALGYTNETPPQSGVQFFTMKDGATEFNASSITLNPDIVANVGKIPSSGRVLTDSSNNIVKDANGNETVVMGNNTIALLTAQMQDQTFSFDPTANGIPILTNGTFDEFFNAVVGQLGVQAQEADRQSQNQQALVDQVDSRRQSVSGVSLDEEMANMLKFQQAYNASARILTTFDDMLDRVINNTGTVGR